VVTPRDWSQRLSIVVIGLLVSSVLAVLLMDAASVSAVRTGDFPAFYSMAVIADGDQPERLYDSELQGAIQASLWRSHLVGAMLPGAYPPYVAYVLRPLAWLGPVLGRAVWSLACIGLLVVAVAKAAELSPDLRRRQIECVAAALAFMPLLVGTIGGQLVAVSAAIYVGLLRITFCNEVLSKRDEVRLGMLAGAWLFKPQYAVVVLLLLVLTRRLRAIVAFAAVAAVWFLLGVQVLGWSWPIAWLDFAGRFAEMNFASNSFQMTNIFGALRQLSQNGTLPVDGRVVAGVASCIALGIAVVWAMWATRRPMYSSLLLLPSLLAVATPQANFYDLGLTCFPLLLLFNPFRIQDRWLLASLWTTTALISCAKSPDQFPWFALLACGVLLVISRRVARVFVVRAAPV
jgi:hypothetical protein